MKINKLGELPTEKVYNGVCAFCTTDFDFIESDATTIDDNTIYVRCPLCSKTVNTSIDKFTLGLKTEVAAEHNALVSYILANWATLPKSTFNNKECVIFDQSYYDDAGYGNHSYEGYGVTADGTIVVCTSGGCSCDGSCCMEPFTVSVSKENSLDFNNYNPELINFDSLKVSFSDY